MKAQTKKLLPIYIIGTSILVALLFFPVLIGGQEESPPPSSSLSPTIRPTMTIFSTQTPLPTRLPDSQDSTSLTSEEQAYDQFLIEHHTSFNQYMNDLGGLFIQAGEDESLLKDDNWRLSVEKDLELMISEAEMISGYENVPEKFSSVQQWMIQLEPETRLLSELILNALEDEKFAQFEAERVNASLFNLLNIAMNATTEREKILAN